MNTMFQLTRSGMVFSGSDADLEAARDHFQRNDWIRFPSILDRELWDMIQHQLAASNLEGKSASIYPEFSVSDGALILLLNNERFFRLIERITQCGHIGSLRGRIYRIVPGANDHADHNEYQAPYEILTGWHTDLNETRLLALSINLNTEPYQGGLLSMREAKTRRMLCELPNPVFGDAILFRVDERLEHRVSNVDGTVPKIAFSGWFESQPDYRTLIAEGIARSLRRTA